MTQLGKILVIVNLAFSLLLASWAFSLYANGIDWSNHQAKADELGGEFFLREEQLKELWQGLPPAQTSWLAARRKLQAEEGRLVADRKWYDEAMKHVFVKADAANPVGAVAIADKDDDRTGVRKGQVLLDNNGFPKLDPLTDRAGKPLQSLAHYNGEDEKILRELDEIRKRHIKQIEEANRLTDEITGDPDKGVRGLQQRIRDEKAKIADIVAERKLLEPLLVNTVVDSELIAKRRTQLDKRIKELKNIGVASGK